MKIITIFLLAFSCTSYGRSKGDDKLPCPGIILEGPKNHKTVEGEGAVFSIKPFGKIYDNNLFVYNWSVTSGAITDGQGTSIVNVDTKALKGQNITITVEVGGIEKECPNSKSLTIRVVGEKMKATKKVNKPKTKTKKD